MGRRDWRTSNNRRVLSRRVADRLAERSGRKSLRLLGRPRYRRSGGVQRVQFDEVSGSVSIWKKGAGTPTVYIDSAIELMQWCGFDNKGNLFVDGLPPPAIGVCVCRAAKGSKTFTNIKLDGIVSPATFSGTAVRSRSGIPRIRAVQRFSRTGVGAVAKITGKTVSRFLQVYQSWIAGDTVIGPDDGPSQDTVQLWKYPAGGKPAVTLSKGSSTFFNGPFGAAVSPRGG